MLDSSQQVRMMSAYREIFHLMDDGMCICEMVYDVAGKPVNYRFIDINPAFEKHTGINLLQAKNKLVTEVVPGIENDPSDWFGTYASVVANNEVKVFENHSEPLDKWYWVKAFPLGGAQFGAIFRDITESKLALIAQEEAQSELKSVNIEYETILESMNDGMIFQNMQGVTEYSNPRALKILHLSEDQLYGRSSYSPDWKAVLPDYSEFPAEDFPIIQAIKFQKVTEHELMGIQVTKTGQFSWLHVSAAPLFDSNGEQLGAIAIFRDITELKHREEQVRQKEQTSQFLFENVSDVVCLMDLKGQFINASPSSGDVLGIDPQALYNLDLYHSVYAEDVEILKSSFQSVIDHKKLGRISYRFELLDGDLIWLEAILKPILDNNNEVTQILATIRNIDRNKQYELELHSLNEELNRSNKELSDFAYVASHDLSAPLRNIMSFSSLLKKQYGESLGTKGLQYLDFTIAGGQRLNKMIEDLLRYSRVNSGKVEFRLVDLRALSDGVVDTIQNEDFTDVKISNEIAHIDVPVIESLIARVLQNLIGNAVKFRKPNEPLEITLSSKFENEYFVVSISDNGIGIDPSFHERIFKIFQRLHNETEYPGTGIGLAIVRRVMELHQGVIELTSEEGQGSTFRCYFPLTQASLLAQS